ncbi:hypothetical protein CK215_15790 [Mesorhizobium sp. WSM3864]|uniref:DUF1156 domain-containing protein n=1 Tax=Mesorhizobium sp. WSM3864 TaxID=2029404 RepID=UPI000BB09EED|nr:DUF1156 domain-containing protein [Mesorhizobium sp. WSM3864]PBB91720.1 hypothetical protein CK215_15790 [Mesorhizobium sp. WSM3864]
MTVSPSRKKLIEVSIPLEAINKESQRRKQKAPKGYPTSIHKYWAQRPIAACRAVLFAQLVDDPSSWPDKFPTETAQEAERLRLHGIIERMIPWEASNDEAILNEVRWEIARSVAWGIGDEPPVKGDGKAILSYLQQKAPPVYDPFSGAGSIPLEAQRLGLRAYGSDLNPVAALIGKALVEIPPKFAGRPPLNPRSQAELNRGGRWSGKDAQGLAEDVRYYGEWMRDEAEKRLSHFYPKAQIRSGAEVPVIAWLWARTVRSPDPAAKGAMVPLVSSFMLSTKENRKVWVEPTLDLLAQDGWRFEIGNGALSKEREKSLAEGTKAGRASFRCLLTGSNIDGTYIDAEGQAGRMSSRLMAIVVEDGRSRVYLAPDDKHAGTALSAAKHVDEFGDEMQLPRQKCRGTFASNAQGRRYCFDVYADYFTPRQLIALTTLSDLVSEARTQVFADARTAGLADDNSPLDSGGTGAQAYADAVATYLGLAVDRMVAYGSSLCKWLTKDNALAPSMPQQGILMNYDFAEGNPLGKSSSEVTQCVSVVAACLDCVTPSSPGIIEMQDAREAKVTSDALISTDPPYYDNIMYADASDFFYVWLSRTLKGVWPALFRRIQTPKEQELVASSYRHGGPDGAYEFFMHGMSQALARIRENSTAHMPLAIYYAFKQTDTAADGVSSKGWGSFLQALRDSGLLVDGTWPLRTELTSALKSDVNSLASSIVLVCRRDENANSTIDRSGFTTALRRELPAAIAKIRAAGVGPVDMQQSVIGPGMGVFTRYTEVLEDDDSEMSVRTALSIINRVWEEIDNEIVASFDPETQVALAWFSSYGFEPKPSGEMITLANAKDTSINDLFDADVFQDLKGRTALTPRDKLDPHWSPARDRRLTVWECVQHLARALHAEGGGAQAAARLIAEMGPKATDARALLDRLFQVATDKGWAQEALVYNQLAEEWPHLLDRSVNISDEVRPAETGDLFA